MSNSITIYIGIDSLADTSSPHDYAQSCQLYSIFSQISRTVARKNNLHANQAISEYLNQCNKGQHVVLKSYISFSKSTVNRQCFLYNFCKIFQTESNSRNGLDYYQLFRLLCSDFPKQIIINSVRLIEENQQKNMISLLNSKTFLNALYINFIYSEYLDAMLQKVFSGNSKEKTKIIQIYKWIKQQDLKNIKTTQKPMLSILFQIILNQITKMNKGKGQGITFLNEDTIDMYVDQHTNGNDQAVLSYEDLCQELLHNKKHQIIVQKNLNTFENSTNWAADAAKLVNSKEADPQPLNARKVKQKK